MASVGSKRSADPRVRRKIRVRKRVKGLEGRPRVCAFRSSKHTYAQVISDVKGEVLVSASTLEEEVTKRIAALKKSIEGAEKRTVSSKGTLAAQAVGIVLAERCKSKNISSVVFDRNGFLYHGRVEAIAKGARDGGLQF